MWKGLSGEEILQEETEILAEEGAHLTGLNTRGVSFAHWDIMGRHD
jgi:hypothetical protein